MVTGQFRNQSCQLSRVQLINRGVSRLHVWLRPQRPTTLLNTQFRGVETLAMTFLPKHLGVRYENGGHPAEEQKSSKSKTKPISPLPFVQLKL